MSWELVSDDELAEPRLQGYLVLLSMFRRRRPDELGCSCFRVFRLVY